jgi:CPA2 family monovalent cation:H+ antiporter-2
MALILMTSLIFAITFAHFGYPYLLGYIFTGIFLGPFFVRIIEYPVVIEILGEMGLLMLLFIVGIEFDLIKFKKSWKKSLLIFAMQFSISFMFFMFLKFLINFSTEYAVLFSFLMTLSSTAVVVKLLEEMGELNSDNGYLIISILIVQDIAVLPMMLILNGMDDMLFIVSLKMLFSIGVLVALIYYLGLEHNKEFNMLRRVFKGNQEIMTLTSLAICFAFSSLAAYLDLSNAYGAFLAGLILGSFGNKNTIIRFSLPVGTMLIMMFFISVGASVNINYIIANWYKLVFFSFSFIGAKILFNYSILQVLRIRKRDSFFIAMMLSQASEFSFSFLVIMFNRGVLSPEMKNMLDALVIISLTVGSILPVICKRWSEKQLKEEKCRV